MIAVRTCCRLRFVSSETSSLGDPLFILWPLLQEPRNCSPQRGNLHSDLHWLAKRRELLLEVRFATLGKSCDYVRECTASARTRLLLIRWSTVRFRHAPPSNLTPPKLSGRA